MCAKLPSFAYSSVQKINFKESVALRKPKKPEYRSGYWKERENQKLFLQSFAIKHGIHQAKDWGNITTRFFSKKGGVSLLKHFNGSLFTILKSSFPETKWNISWFTKKNGFWRDPRNAKEFIESVRQHFQIRTPKDWGNITKEEFVACGGGSLLNCYRGSLILTLTSLYPEIKWKTEWFRNRKKHAPHFWDLRENRISFLEELYRKNDLKSSFDWRKVTNSLIKQSGGEGLLNKYEGSIVEALKATFPQQNWEHLVGYRRSFACSVAKTQVSLTGLLKQILPGETC